MPNDGKLLQTKIQMQESGLFKKINNQEVWCRCPFCGDNHENFNIKFIMDDDTPLLYHCWICEEGGLLTNKLLTQIGLDNPALPSTINFDKSKSKSIKNHQSISNEIFKLSDYYNNEHRNEVCSNYIYKRIEFSPDIQTMQMFNIIPDIEKYCNDFRINYNKYMNERVWFRMKNGMLAGRLIDDNPNQQRWMKLKPGYVSGITMYTVQKPFDVTQNLTIFLSEGVLDSIGLFNYFNENDYDKNALFISCMGRGYDSVIRSLIVSGLFGKSVSICIMCDADYTNPKYEFAYNQLFSNIKLFTNDIKKDFGYPISDINMVKLK